MFVVLCAYDYVMLCKLIYDFRLSLTSVGDEACHYFALLSAMWPILETDRCSHPCLLLSVFVTLLVTHPLYCNGRMCMSVCLFVCLHISDGYKPKYDRPCAQSVPANR